MLERTVGDSGKLRTDIAVADVRETVQFFGSTAGEGGWRVCIVDSAEELNREGANTLLKILEEPPARALLLVVSHAPGRLLPTIRSRCRRLNLAAACGRRCRCRRGAGARHRCRTTRSSCARHHSPKAASPARSRSMDGPLLTLREKIGDLLARLPETDPQALHALGDSLGRADDAAMTTFNDAVREWLGDQVERGGEPGRLVRIADAWETVQPRRGRCRNLQYRAQTAGFRHIRVACRGGAPLIPRPG